MVYEFRSPENSLARLEIIEKDYDFGICARTSGVAELSLCCDERYGTSRLVVYSFALLTVLHVNCERANLLPSVTADSLLLTNFLFDRSPGAGICRPRLQDTCVKREEDMTFNTMKRLQSLYCIWIKTGNLRHPLKCVWLDLEMRSARVTSLAYNESIRAAAGEIERKRTQCVRKKLSRPRPMNEGVYSLARLLIALVILLTTAWADVGGRIAELCPTPPMPSSQAPVSLSQI